MLLQFLVLFLTLHSLAATSTLKRVRRVIGGYETDVRNVPYLVNIRRDGKMKCGGSLITPKCVLSAAHCVRDSPPEQFVIRGGVTYLREDQNSRRVKSIFLPEAYNGKSMNMDIAIFQLAGTLEGDNISTIKLSKVSLENGDMVTVSGWGLTVEGGINPSNQIRSVNVRVLSHKICRELYKDFRNLTYTMFCASIPGVKDACLADSGGPAVYNGELAGIVSWGRKRECGRVDSPGIYVNVKEASPWINNIMSEHCL